MCQDSTPGLNSTKFWHVGITSSELILLLVVNNSVQSALRRWAFDGRMALCVTHLCTCVNVSQKAVNLLSLLGFCQCPPSGASPLLSTQAELHLTFLSLFFFLLPALCLCFHLPVLQSAPHGGGGRGGSFQPLQSLCSVFPPSVCCDLAPLSQRRSPLT